MLNLIAATLRIAVKKRCAFCLFVVSKTAINKLCCAVGLSEFMHSYDVQQLQADILRNFNRNYEISQSHQIECYVVNWQSRI